jgi:hypothetical protein
MSHALVENQQIPSIYRTWGKHANHYTTDEPSIYRTWGKHANHYTTDVVQSL